MDRYRKGPYEPGDRVRTTRDFVEAGEVWLPAGSTGTVLEVRRSASDEYQRDWSDRRPRYRTTVAFDARGEGSRVGVLADDIERSES